MLSLTICIKNILGIFFTTFFLHRFANYEKHFRKLPFSIFLCSLIALGILLPFFFNEEDASTWGDLLTILSFCIMPYFTLKRKKWYVFALFGLVANSALDFFVETINYFLKFDSAVVTNLIFSAILLILFLVLYIVQKLAQSNVSVDIFEKIPTIIYVIIFLLSLSSYYMMMLPKDSEFTQSTSTTLRIVSSIFMVICLIYMMLKYTAAIKTETQLQFQVATQIEQYKLLQKNNSDIRKFRHDYNNNMIALSLLLDGGKIEEAKDFIKKMNKQVVKSNVEFSTGNYLADAIISYKASQALINGITITFDGTIPISGISNNDLSVILSNLIDNAVRGCEGCEPCKISVKSVESDAGVFITITNPVKENIDVSQKLRTTKKDRKNHGLGTGNIKKTVKKYHGSASFDCKDNIFTAKVGLII